MVLAFWGDYFVPGFTFPWPTTRTRFAEAKSVFIVIPMTRPNLAYRYTLPSAAQLTHGTSHSFWSGTLIRDVTPVAVHLHDKCGVSLIFMTWCRRLLDVEGFRAS
jgi:hypothetical protein